MTKAEAIILLQSRADLIKSDYPDIGDYAEALLMAIKALNHFAGDSKKVSFSCGQEKDLISKADVCEILADVFPTDGEKVVYVEEIENAYQEIIELPYIQPFVIHCTDCEDWYKRQSVWNVAISELPSAQPEQSSEIQDILDYLDTVLHPIVSPEHWNVYSELHDMISTLPSAQPEPSDSVYRLYKRAYEAGQRNAQPELHFDEWCTDCKEYDQERHRCPRWNRVIRETLKDAQPKIIHCRDCKYGEQDEIGRWYCRGLGRQIGDDDGSGFCADAERRTDE